MDEMTRRELLQIAGAAGVTGTAQTACAQFSWLKDQPQTPNEPLVVNFDVQNPAIQYHPMECERCGDCVKVCKYTQTVFEQKPAIKQLCIHCGQCVANCWNDGITERFHLQDVVLSMRANAEEKDPAKKKTYVAITSPAVRAALGEMFKMEQGTNCEGQMVAAARRVGFDYVLDATFGADVTIVEEAAEFKRILEKQTDTTEKRPFFTSCCPAWVTFAELFFPEVLPRLSSCKSPLMMQSALIKTNFAETHKLDPKNLVVVAIAPCTAKKAELLRPEMNSAGTGHDLDYVLTTREFGWWLRGMKIDLAELEPAKYDDFIGEGSGSAALFGNTGGVTESVLRTLHFMLTGEKPGAEFFHLTPVRGLDGLRQAEVKIGDRTLKIGVIHGAGVAREVLSSKEKFAFDFVEVMACRGGCIGGGGQPKTEIPLTDALRAKRMKVLYTKDDKQEVRLSLENPQIQKLYGEFLQTQGSEKAQKLLHWKAES